MDGRDYTIYSDAPEFVVCDAYADELTLRRRGRRNGMSDQSSFRRDGKETENCVSAGMITSVYGGELAEGRIRSAAESFCAPNHRGIVTKKTAGTVVSYTVSAPVAWAFEELVTAHGNTLRPIPIENLPEFKNLGQSIVASPAEFKSHQGCIDEVMKAGRKSIEDVKTTEAGIYRNFAD